LRYAKENNLNKVWELYDIQTKDDLKELANDEKVVNLLEYVKENNLNKV
jgi:hypothetical protein